MCRLMITRKFSLRVLLPMLLSFCLCFSLSASCFAGEAASTGATAPKELTITAAECGRLESNLNELARLNKASQQELKGLRSQLAASQAASSKAQQQSIELTHQLEALKRSSADQEKLLQNLSQSLKALEQEKKEQLRTQGRLKWQRNIAWGILGCVLVASVCRG